MKAPNIDTQEHLQSFKKWIQDNIAAVQSAQAAISSMNQTALEKAFSDWGNVGSQASQIIRATESLMVKYNISDSEVNYKFRGK